MADNDHNNENEKDKEEQEQDISDETGSETPENQAEESGDAGEGEKKKSRSRSRRENTPDWNLIRQQVNKAEPISLEDEMKRCKRKENTAELLRLLLSKTTGCGFHFPLLREIPVYGFRRFRISTTNWKCSRTTGSPR